MLLAADFDLLLYEEVLGVSCRCLRYRAKILVLFVLQQELNTKEKHQPSSACQVRVSDDRSQHYIRKQVSL